MVPDKQYAAKRSTIIASTKRADDEYIMVDSGAPRATCPPTHAPTIPACATETPQDIRLEDDRSVHECGNISVTCKVQEAECMGKHELDWQVAEVSLFRFAGSEACGKGHSVLFPPHGSIVVRMPLELTSGVPNVPLMRHRNLYRMRSQPVGAPSDRVMHKPNPCWRGCQAALRETPRVRPGQVPMRCRNTACHSTR